MKRSNYWRTVFDGIVDALAIFAGVLLVLMMLFICLDVVMRYFIKHPLAWVDQLSEYVLLYVTFCATTWLLKREGHVVVDILMGFVKAEARERIAAFSNAVGIFVCATFTYYGAKVTWELFARGIYNPSVWEVPKGALVLIIPLGSFLLLVQFVRAFFKSLGLFQGR